MSLRPYNEAELGIGAADQPPSFGDSIRLDDSPWGRLGLLALEILGSLGLAALAGIVAGMLMLHLER